MKLVVEARRAITKYPFFERRSDWTVGVCWYAYELFDTLLERRNIKSDDVFIGKVIDVELLDGVKDWYDYSYKGKSLKLGDDIRKRLSPTTPAKANDDDFWLDIQAEALSRAAQVVKYAVNNHLPGEKWKKGRGKVSCSIHNDSELLKGGGVLRMETYREMRERHLQEFNRLPLFFAFTKEKFEQELKKRSVTEEDVYSTGHYGFYLKSDADLIHKTAERFANELEEGIKDDNFLYSAFFYELENHEFALTYDPSEALEVLDLTIEDVNNDERMSRLFNLAKKIYLWMEQNVMDKILLTRDDRLALRIWADNNAALVVKTPCPLRAVEIEGILKDSSAKIYRDDKFLKCYFFDDGIKAGRVDFEIDVVTDNGAVTADINVKKIVGMELWDRDSLALAIKHYFAAMAFMTYAKEDVEVSDNSPERKIHKPRSNANHCRNNGITYVLKFRKPVIEHELKGHHASPKGIFTVRGHFRHYKSGKEIWIEQFQKGTGEKRQKNYKLRGVA